MKAEIVSVAELSGRGLDATGISRRSATDDLVAIEFREVGESTLWEVRAELEDGRPVLRVIRKTPGGGGG